jgi:hypothetical protein
MRMKLKKFDFGVKGYYSTRVACGIVKSPCMNVKLECIAKGRDCKRQGMGR